jgi:hypothetical protein
MLKKISNQHPLQIFIKVRFIDFMGHKNRVRMKSESGSLHFVSLRSSLFALKLTLFLQLLDVFVPLQNPFQIGTKVGFLDIPGHKTR